MEKFNRVVVVALAAMLMSACGGGGDGDGAAAPPPGAIRVAVKVIDGPIGNALVCLDRNQNDACDGDEPSGRTSTDGQVTLEVPSADAGKFPVVAVVGTDAVDAEHGKVGTAFKLKAPADRPSLVSPLTTLVQQTVGATGAGSAAAEAVVQDRLDLRASLFTDYTTPGAAEGERLATMARLLVVFAQMQSDSLAASAGSKAIDGVAMQAGDIERAIRQNLYESLPAVVMAAGDDRLLAGGTSASRRRAIAAVAADLAATAGVTTVNLPTRVGVARQPEQARVTGVAVASLVALDYKSSARWTRHVATSSARHNDPDASGNVRVLERRSRKAGGLLASWGWGATPARQGEIHWNGSAWVHCQLNEAGASGAPDAAGRVAYERCGGVEHGIDQRASFDVSGRRMTAVYQQVRDGGLQNLSIVEPNAVLGGARFPPGSRLSYSVRTPMHTAVSYSSGLGAIVSVFPAPVAAGEPQACDRPDAMTDSRPAETFAVIVRRNRGTPCSQAPVQGSGPRNELWAQSTLPVAFEGTAPLSSLEGYYTTNHFLRAGFGEDRKVTYYRCRQRAADGAVLNCDVEGEGSYEIEDLGGARLMVLRGQPPSFVSQLQERILIEREGLVHLGFRDRPTPVRTAQLNLHAMNALHAALQLPEVDPERRITLTDASYDGIWSFDAAGGQQPLVYRHFSLSEHGNFCSQDGIRFYYGCSISIVAASGAFTFEDGSGGGGSGVMHFVEGKATLAYTPLGGTRVELQGRRR